jgi:hypothetical protein
MLEASIGIWVVECDSVTDAGIVRGSVEITVTPDTTEVEAIVAPAAKSGWRLLDIFDTTGVCAVAGVAFFSPLSELGAVPTAAAMCRANQRRIRDDSTVEAIGRTRGLFLGAEVYCGHVAGKVVLPNDWADGIHCIPPGRQGVFLAVPDYVNGTVRISRPSNFGGARFALPPDNKSDFSGWNISVWLAVNGAGPRAASTSTLGVRVSATGGMEITSLPPGKYHARLISAVNSTESVQPGANVTRSMEWKDMITFAVNSGGVTEVIMPVERTSSGE